MALFSKKSNTSIQETNVEYSPTEISTTVGPTITDVSHSVSTDVRSQSSTNIRNDLFNSNNITDAYNRTIQVSQPVLIAGAGAETLMRGTGLDLQDFFDPPSLPSDGEKPASLLPWIIAAAVILFFILRRK